jgi:uncharacterized Zn finger protein (UPF0148 family)
MRAEILAGTQCDACGSWEFECRDEQFLCIACQLPANEMEIESESMREEVEKQEQTTMH